MSKQEQKEALRNIRKAATRHEFALRKLQRRDTQDAFFEEQDASEVSFEAKYAALTHGIGWDEIDAEATKGRSQGKKILNRRAARQASQAKG